MPQHGRVTLNGVELELGDRFTQADLEAGRVANANNGDGTAADRLIVSVSDQDGNALGDVIGAGAASAFRDAEYMATGFLNFIHTADAYARAAAYGTTAAGTGGSSGSVSPVIVASSSFRIAHSALDRPGLYPSGLARHHLP